MTAPDRPPRAPLKPIPEGWRRLALVGPIALGLIGALAALGLVRLLPWLIKSG